jgi:hypothetical protein
MAVAYDAVGPGATGTGVQGPASLSWSHTVTGSNIAVLAGVAVDGSPDTMTCTATCNGTSMTSLGKVHSGGSTAGYLEVFGIAAVTAGSASLVATASSAPADLNGGSLSFTGVSPGTPFGTAASASGNSGTASAATAGSTSGNMVAGFAIEGTGITSATAPSTSRFIENYRGIAGNAAGNSAGATSPSTGSAVTMAWAVTSDFWAALAVEVLAGGAGQATAVLATGTGAALTALTSPSALLSGPDYPALASVLGGGSGTWTNPLLAEGPP